MSSTTRCSLCFLSLWSIILLIAQDTFATEYADCGSRDTIYSFNLTNCDLPPCIYERPGWCDVNITFRAESSCQTLDTKIYANIGGDIFPWPAPNGCALLVNGSCPIEAGTTYFYRATMPILSEYPAVTAQVTWQLVDELEVMHVCTQVPIMLV